MYLCRPSAPGQAADRGDEHWQQEPVQVLVWNGQSGQPAQQWSNSGVLQKSYWHFYSIQ